MFSDKFTEINNYSIFKKEYVSASSVMPWRLTSVNDEIYEPELSEVIKNRLKLFFYFRYQYTQLLIEDDDKFLELTHSDGNILEFNSICPIQSLPFAYIPEWNNFINTIESSNLYNCIEKLLKFQKELIKATFVSTTFDENGQATGIYIAPNVRDFISPFDLIQKINTAILEMESCSCLIHVNPIDNSVRYKISPNYSDRAIGFVRTTKNSLLNASNAIIQKKYYNDYTEKCIDILIKNEVITSDMADYIYEVMPENTKMGLEFLINEDGTAKDIILNNTVIEKFTDISEEQRLAKQYDKEEYYILE